jgi:uncharacterized protein (DUF305 family)
LRQRQRERAACRSTVLAFGKDPEVKKVAEDIINAQ